MTIQQYKFNVIESDFDNVLRVRAYDVVLEVPGFRTREHVNKNETNVAKLRCVYSPRRRLLEFESFHQYILSFRDIEMTLEQASWSIVDQRRPGFMINQLHVTDIIGFIGSMTIVILYYLNIRGAINSEGAIYPLANLIAGVCLLVSLSRNVNLPSIVIEIFWCAISIYGLTKYFIYRKNK